MLGTVLGAGEKTSHKVCDWQDFYSHGPCNKRKNNKKLESCMFYDLNEARKHVRKCLGRLQLKSKSRKVSLKVNNNI